MQGLQIYPKETFLCSFDIRSLFNHVSLAGAIQICTDALYGGELIPLDYPKETFIELINTATTVNQWNSALTTTCTSKLMAWRWVVHQVVL